MRRGLGLGANLATLANGLVGAGAIAYTLAGNELWAMLLIVSGIGFDGLDGWLHRRSGLPSGLFGRVADSISDSVTFGLAPAFLLVVHPYHATLWAPYGALSFAAGAVVATLAFARLAWFTLRAYDRPDFVGAPTPQNALGVVALLLFFDVPAFLGTNPPAALVGAMLLAATMVVPVPFPKLRRGSRLRAPMAVTGLALVGALLPLQFSLRAGDPWFEVAFGFSCLASAGVALYYLAGPWTVPRGGDPHRPGAP